MRHAKIENGIVRKFINFNPKGRFTKEVEEKYVQCDDNVERFDIYKDGEFSKPIPILPTQEEINQQTIQELNETNNQLTRLIEDIAEFCEGLGFIIPTEQKELINIRKEKRKNIK